MRPLWIRPCSRVNKQRQLIKKKNQNKQTGEMVMLCSNNLHHAHLFDPFVCSLEIANLYCFRIIFKTESSNLYTFHFHIHSDNIRGRLGRDRMVATTTYAISAYHH